MKRRRLTALACIIGTGAFASFFGGAFSYALFYASLIIPLMSLVYALYIYLRLKIYQSIYVKTMTKGDRTDYDYSLTNEDFIFYKGLSLTFMSDYSKVDTALTKTVSLLPGEKYEIKSGLTCLYRGEYNVGIESVLINDYLGLFSVKMEKPSVISVRVYPRILQLSSLNALNFNEDSKTLPFSFSAKREIPDSDLKKYASGDEAGTINWKVSAKQGELFVRRYTETPKERILIFLDVSAIPTERGDRVILEDKALETVLAIVNRYRRENIESEARFYTDRENCFRIKTAADFNAFYDATAFMRFKGKVKAGAYIQGNLTRLNNYGMLIIVTARVDDKLPAVLLRASGTRSCVILIGDTENSELRKTRSKLGKTKLINIPESGDIGKILDMG